MHLPTLRLALLYGSDRPLRFCDTVAGWAHGRAIVHGGWSIERLDPVTAAGRDTQTLLRRVREADAFRGPGSADGAHGMAFPCLSGGTAWRCA